MYLRFEAEAFQYTSLKSALEIVERRPTPPVQRQFISKTKSENYVTVGLPNNQNLMATTLILFFPKLVNTVTQIVAQTRQHPQSQIQPIPKRVYSR